MNSITRILFVVILCTSASSADDWYTHKSDWHGHAKFYFTVADRPAWLVVPHVPRPGRPWIWRARFPGYHDEVDIEMVEQGFHLGYVDVAGLFGAPSAVNIGDEFYMKVCSERGLSQKPALEGVSRGGLFVYNWAIRNPTLVSCIYCDTPVLDFRSWPGGKGSGKGSQADWKRCMAAYAISAEAVSEWHSSLIETAAETIVQQGIPVLHIVSEDDTVVPPAENTRLLEERVRQAGHSITVMSVPHGTSKSNGHHFTHPDPGRVARFIRKHAAPIQESSVP